MALFKFHKGTDQPATAPVPVPSVETIRQRAKYRLAGASVLVLAGVIGLPLLFDKQPRPIAVDIPIDIPDKNKVLPLVLPVLSATSAPVATAASSPVAKPPTESVAVVSGMPDSESTLETKSTIAKASQPLAATKEIANGATKVAKSSATTSSAKTADATRVELLLAGKDSAVVAATVNAMASAPVTGVAPSRFVVQVGAFADNARAHEVRLKLERAGLKTYAQIADTKDGKRIRVRVGPFATKPEADKAAEKIKKLSLPAALLTL